MSKNRVYCIVYRLRKRGISIDIRTKTIYYPYSNDGVDDTMLSVAVKRLCNEFGFARQAVIV